MCLKTLAVLCLFVVQGLTAVIENSQTVKLSNFQWCGVSYSAVCSSSDDDDILVLPWLVKIVISGPENYEKPICSGTLINERYIVTSAQCIPNDELVNGKRLMVRYGNTYSDKKYITKTCTDEVYIGVEESVVHPFYDRQSNFNDIALLRLNKTLMTRAVNHPICLPLHHTKETEIQKKLVMGRWEKSTPSGLTNTNQCSFIYENRNATRLIKSYNVVPDRAGNAIPITQIDDIGTPLMFFKEKLYFEGFVTQGKDCNNEDPGTYTKITDYLQWIEQNMRPWFPEECSTSIGGKGRCIDLADCPSLLPKFANPTKATEDDLIKNTCEVGERYGYFQGCCDSSSIFSQKNESEEIDSEIKLSNLEQCGFKHESISDDEFPWIAKFIPPGQANTLCLGVLINARYVLTGAWCSYALPEGTIVRLGESNEDYENYYEDVGIEEISSHRFFVDWSRLNNIGLIRLDKTIVFTEYIRPICLPLTAAEAPNFDDTLYTSSWTYALSGREVISKRLSTKFIPYNSCNLSSVMPVDDYSGCTIVLGNSKELLCYGFADTGGPLMFVNNNKWYIEE